MNVMFVGKCFSLSLENFEKLSGIDDHNDGHYFLLQNWESFKFKITFRKSLLHSQTDVLLQECGHQFHIKCIKLPKMIPFDDSSLCKRLSFIDYKNTDRRPNDDFCPVCTREKSKE